MNALSALLSHEIAEWIGWTLLHSIWQGAAVAVLLAAVLRLLAKSSAHLRYVAACVALAAMVLLPAVTGEWPSRPAVRVTAQAGPTAPLLASPPAKGEPSKAAIPMAYADTSAKAAGKRDWRDAAAARLRFVLPYAAYGWLIGVLLLSLRHALAWGRLRHLRRRQVRPADASLCERLAALARKLGIERAVQLVESALVQVPTVIGWLRPMILLPASALTGLDRDQLEALLLHELAHIRRHDYLVNLVQTVVEILGFYHPAVWWVSHRIRIEREDCCDDVAAETLGDNLRYARALASMEEIRAGRPEWGLAASGGSLPARIRRLVGRQSAGNRPSPWAPVLAVVVLVLSLAVPAGLALADYYTDPATELEREVVKGFTENRARFACGVLAWTVTTEDRGVGGRFVSVPSGGLKYGGQYRMWWDGDKVATKWTIEGIHSSREVPPGEDRTSWQGKDGLYYWIGQTEGSNVYTGGLLVREPRWKPYENWFNDVIRWRGPASLDKGIIEGGRMKHMAVEWSTVDVDGARLIRRMSKNIDPADVSYGYSTIEHYDPARGYGRVREEWYSPSGARYVDHATRLGQVIPGAWFPVEVVMESSSMKDGSLFVRRQLVLDLGQCRFNDRSALPEGVFETFPRREQDETRQTLEKIVQRQTKSQPDDAGAKTQGARSSVEGFLAAALRGDYEAAAAFAHPKRPLDDLKEFKELLAGQDVRTMAVFADDEAALAVTSALRADHGQAGPMTLQLVKTADSPAGWLIEDIDVETPPEAGSEVEQFLRAHPAAVALLVQD